MCVGDQQEGNGENSEARPGRLNGVGHGVRPRASAQKPGEKGAMHSAFDITGCATCVGKPKHRLCVQNLGADYPYNLK